jgi:radical SAM superfamily enzyme YgiQ (UPF0313 family)
MKIKKILLIFPNGGSVREGMPLSYGFIKSNVDKSQYDIKVLDCTLNNIISTDAEFRNEINNIKPELIGISSFSFNFQEVLAMSKIIKQINPNVVTIVGGPHATVNADKIAKCKEFDFIFRGEAELAFSKFLDEINREPSDFSKVEGLAYRNKDGDFIYNEIARVENLDQIKIPDYDAINLNLYIEKGYSYQGSKRRNAPLIATKGCPYGCAFCSASVISGRKIRRFSVEYMINWIRYLYVKHDIRGFNIIDDNFTFDKDYVEKFCNSVLKLRYKDVEFNTPNGIRMEKGNIDLWKRMRKTGWRSLTIAPESGSLKVLKSMIKNLNLNIVPSIVKDIKKSGLMSKGFIMVGYPGETVRDIRKTKFLIKKCRFDSVSVHIFQPLPGTHIFDELVRKNEITDEFMPRQYCNYNKAIYKTTTLKGINISRVVNNLIFTAILYNPMVLFMIFKPHFKRIIYKPTDIFKVMKLLISKIWEICF